MKGGLREEGKRGGNGRREGALKIESSDIWKDTWMESERYKIQRKKADAL
jgi:hypothetical protein